MCSSLERLERSSSSSSSSVDKSRAIYRCKRCCGSCGCAAVPAEVSLAVLTHEQIPPASAWNDERFPPNWAYPSAWRLSISGKLCIMRHQSGACHRPLPAGSCWIARYGIHVSIKWNKRSNSSLHTKAWDARSTVINNRRCIHFSCFVFRSLISGSRSIGHSLSSGSAAGIQWMMLVWC